MGTAFTGPLPFVSCLCPTFHRPRLLANALACFLAQDYPSDRRELIILDDGGDFAERPMADGWTISLSPGRFPSLPEKFNAVASQARGEIIFVFEDDDIYLPHHISSHVATLQTYWGYPLSGFSKPSRVLSTYTGQVETEDASGRFHASIAFTRGMFDHLGGWPQTKRADFDQQFIRNLSEAVRNELCDPCEIAPPSYCFRYGSTQEYHGQHFMRSADDESWYGRVPHRPGEGNLILRPEFDSETRRIFASHSIGKSLLETA